MQPYEPIRAKHEVLQVILPGRVTQESQDMVSIDSQHSSAEEWLSRNYSGEKTTYRLGEQISGWVPGRSTMVTAKDLIAEGKIDLVVAHEVREIYRHPGEAWNFIYFCIDHNVRVILLFDRVDTTDPYWDAAMHNAMARAGLEVPVARMRVRRKATEAFSRGGMVAKVRFGYRKLTKEESLSGQFGTPGLRIAKLSEYTPIIRKMKDRVTGGASPRSIARWLIDEEVQPGPYVEGGVWNDRVVEELLRDRILSGRRRFRVTLSKHHYGTGKHRRVRNEEAAESKDWPELAHMTPEEQDQMIRALDERRQGRDFVKGSEHVRANIPRSDSLWPGQHARCANCGSLMYRYGKFIRCKNSFGRSAEACWNHAQVDIEMLRDKVLPWFVATLDKYPKVRNVVIDSAWAEYQRVMRRRFGSSSKWEGQIEAWREEAQNLRKAIKLGRHLESLVADLDETENKIEEAEKQKAANEKRADGWGNIRSREHISTRFLEHVIRMAENSFEFAAFMRRMIPSFTVHPVQALDCDQVRPRVKITLRVESWATGDEVREVSATFDVFKYPEHVKNLDRILAEKQADPTLTYRQLGAKLGVNYMTVKRAISYKRLMDLRGLREPFIELTAPPTKASRWKRRPPSPNDENAA